jgi:hypothetical protein
MEQRLGPALVELNELLENASKELHASIQFALIGGLAVAAWESFARLKTSTSWQTAILLRS